VQVFGFPMLILGIGIGLFVVILIWVVALLACFLSAHCKKNVGLYAVILASVLTLILFVIPKEENQDDTVKVGFIECFSLFCFLMRLLHYFVVLSASILTIPI